MKNLKKIKFCANIKIGLFYRDLKRISFLIAILLAIILTIYALLRPAITAEKASIISINEETVLNEEDCGEIEGTARISEDVKEYLKEGDEGDLTENDEGEYLGSNDSGRASPSDINEESIDVESRESIDLENNKGIDLKIEEISNNPSSLDNLENSNDSKDLNQSENSIEFNNSAKLPVINNINENIENSEGAENTENFEGAENTENTDDTGNFREIMNLDGIGNDENLRGVIEDSSDYQLQCVLKSGASLNDKGDYVWTADKPYSGHAFVYRISFSMSGEYEKAANSIEISIPKSIIYNRDGNNSDFYEMSIPEENDSIITDLTSFVYRKEGDNILIYNRLPLSSAEQLYIEVSYSTLEKSYEYLDYDPAGESAVLKHGSRPFQALLYIDNNEIAQSDEIPVYIDTKASDISTYKGNPVFYTEWQNKWGESPEPESVSEYYYLLWEAKTIIKDTTQPYDFSLYDSFSPENEEGEIVGETLAYKLQGEDFVYVNDNEGNINENAGCVKGLKTNYSYGRFDYILTRHLKSEYESKDNYKLSNQLKVVIKPIDLVDSPAEAVAEKEWIYRKKTFSPPSGRFSLYKWGLDCNECRVYDSEDIRSFKLSEFMESENALISDLAYDVYMDAYPGKLTVSERSGDSGENVENGENDGENVENGENEGENLENGGNSDENVENIGNEEEINENSENGDTGYSGSEGAGDIENLLGNYQENFQENYLENYPEDYPGNYWKKKLKYELIDSLFYLKTIDGEYSDALTKDDYQIDSIELSCFGNDGVYNDDRSQFVSLGSVNYEEGESVSVYIQIDGEPLWTKVAKWDLFNGEIIIEPGMDQYVLSVSGKQIKFNNEYFTVTAFKLEAENAHYYFKLGACPEISLRHSETVDRISSNALNLSSGGQCKIVLKNTAKAIISDTEGNIISAFERSGEDIVIGVRRQGELEKAVAAYVNDKTNKQYRITWEATVGESYLIEGNQRSYVEQNGGVFYDLIPKGGYLLKDSLMVYADGVRLEEGEYKLSIRREYEGSNRVLIELGVFIPAEKYRLRYTSVHPWDILNDFGDEIVNDIAYESGNPDIGEGMAKNECHTGDGVLLTKYSKADENANKFLLTSCTHTINALTSASLGLYKKLMSENDSDYSYETNVGLGEDYYYRIRFVATDDVTSAKDLMVFDSLENYVPQQDADGGDWRGTLVNIEVENAAVLNVNPIIYYLDEEIDFERLSENLSDEMNTHNNANAYDESNSNNDEGYDFSKHGWIEKGEYEESNENLEAVRAFAIDLRKSVSGEGFNLGSGQVVAVTVSMKAPDIDLSGKPDPVSYNNIYLYSTIVRSGNDLNDDLNDDLNSNSESGLIHQDYTTAHLRCYSNLELVKLDEQDETKMIEGVKFQLRGQSDYGTVYNEVLTSNRLGKLRFNRLEKGNYTLQEVEGVKDYQEDHSLLHLTIGEDGNIVLDRVSSDNIKGMEEISGEDGESRSRNFRLLISNKPRIHGELKFLKKGRVDGSEFSVPLEGAVFKLSGRSEYGNDILLYQASDNRGIVKFPDIEMGNYSLSEFRPPEGYIIANASLQVYCNSEGLVTLYYINDEGNEIELEQDRSEGEYVLMNEPYHSFRILKQDAISLEPLGGACFRLSGTSDYGNYINIIENTGSNGIAGFQKLESGVFVLSEEISPPNHILDETKYIVKISEEGEVTIEGLTKMTEEGFKDCFAFPNERAYDGIISITKIWEGIEEGEEKLLPTIHLDTEEPKHSPPFAYISPAKWKKLVNNSGKLDSTFVSFTRYDGDSMDEVSANYVSIDDGTTDYNIYFWIDGLDAFWWTDAAVAFLPADCKELFKGLKALNSLEINGLDSSKVTSTRGMFESCEKLVSLDLSGFGSEKLTDTSKMFSQCKALKSLNLVGLKTVNVINMENMFRNCSSLESLDLTSLDTGNVQNMTNMFYGCSKIQEINQSFDTSSVTTMDFMFQGCSVLQTIDLSSFNTERLTNIISMFNGCKALESLDFGSFNTPLLTDMTNCFRNCSQLNTILISNLNINNVENLNYVFSGCKMLSTLDLSSWETESVTKTMYMFNDCEMLKTIYVDKDKWDISSITKNNSSKMFANCRALVGGNNTTYNSSYVDKEYARIDRDGSPGYLSEKELVTAFVSTSIEEAREAEALPYQRQETAQNDYLIKEYFETKSINLKLYSVSADHDISLIPLSMTSRDVIYERDSEENSGGDSEEDTDEVFDKWIENPDGTWTYRFKVYDEDKDYYVWEGALHGYTAEYSLDGNDFVSANSLNLKYTKGQEAHIFIKNIKAEAEAGKGSLRIINKLKTISSSGVIRDNSERDLKQSFSFHIRLDNPLNGYYGDILFIGGEADIKLKADQSVLATGLPIGISYNITEVEKEGFLSEASGETGIISSGEIAKAIFTKIRTINNEDTGGTLIISKSLLAYDEAIEISDTDLLRKFAFDISLSGSENALISGIYGGLVFKDGKSRCYLSDGESVTISGLPSGIQFNVKEDLVASGIFKTRYYLTSITSEALNEDINENVNEDNDEIIDENNNGDYYEDGGEGIVENLDKDVDEDVDEGIERNFQGTLQEGNSAEFSIYEGKTVKLCFENVKISNDKTGNITLNKDLIGTAAEDAFIFYLSFSGLYPYTSYSYGEGECFISDSSGNANIELRLKGGKALDFPLLPAGAKYCISEAANSCISSYHIEGSGTMTPVREANAFANQSLSTLRLNIREGENDVITFVNESPKFEVSFRKINEEKDDIPGAILQIKEAESGRILKEWISEKNTVIQKIPQGSYILHEEKAPIGYANAEDIAFEVQADGSAIIDGQAVSIIALEDPKLKIGILKVSDEENSGENTPLPGAVLMLLSDEELIETWTSTAEDKIVGDKLETDRVYKIREKSVPPGYLPAADINFTIRTDGSVLITDEDGEELPEEEITNILKRKGDYDEIIIKASIGTKLPDTGGAGTKGLKKFRLFGAALIVLSLILLLKKNKGVFMKNIKKTLSNFFFVSLISGCLAGLIFPLILSRADGMDKITISVNSSGQILEDRNETGEEYRAYKIFDVSKIEGAGGNNSSGSTTAEETQGYSYTIKSSDPWYSVVSTRLGAYINLQSVASDDNTYTVILKNTAEFGEDTAKEMADILKANIPDTASVQVFSEEESLSTEPGYYLISSSLGSNLILATTDIAITEKNEYPSIRLSVAKNNVSIREVIDYTIEVDVPSSADASKYMYVSDFLNVPLRLVNTDNIGAVIKGTETEIDLSDISSSETQYYNSGAALRKKFLVGSNVGETVVISFQAELLSSSLADTAYRNSAVLQYSNYKTEEVFVDVRTFDLDIEKINSSNEKLNGAVFEIRKGETKEDAIALEFVSDGDNYVLADSDADSEDKKTEMEVRETNVRGLAEGKYFLFELEAPAGYNLLKEPIEIDIDGSGNVTVNSESSEGMGSASSGLVSVENRAGLILPSTGGSGTVIFTIVGSVILLLSLILYLFRGKFSKGDKSYK